MNTSARSCSRVLLVVGLLGATMVGMVSRAQPASASRQAYATVTSSVIVVDYTRVTSTRGSTDTLPYRSLPTSVIRPDAPGAFPLVVFAAGFNISTETYVAMTGTWAAAGIDVHLDVDGVPNAVVTASDQRADVGAAYDGYGNFHGFSQLTLVQPSGVHTVCAYGINGTGTPGNNALLACKAMVT